MKYTISNRSIALWVVLSILTCGICYLVWIAMINNEIQALKGTNERSGAGVVVLGIITCHIYTLYWLYITGADLQKIEIDNNLQSRDESVAYLLLGLFGFGIVSLALMQRRLNEMVDLYSE
ncbi:MAG: DUF4234 domain-containing protein [Bifidobacteriaceae bacterium]|jgi:hypothetical protein|nr:DUF4234 domain-containing protein [Bifidobacteriaceae bacterium]